LAAPFCKSGGLLLALWLYNSMGITHCQAPFSSFFKKFFHGIVAEFSRPFAGIPQGNQKQNFLALRYICIFTINLHLYVVT
jgi:hypothetical protein